MKFFPIMGDYYEVDDYAHLDLSVISSDYCKEEQIKMHTLKKYIADKKSTQNVKLLYGGYLEQRAIYTSDHFTSESRDIHLGVDIWADANTPIFAPCDMILDSMAYNGADLDYGYTLIYYIENLQSYLLLGHLSEATLRNKKTGMQTKQKDQIATLGMSNENGGWEPHVHIQLIRDLGIFKNDYPGVCTQSEMNFYKDNCPNPLEDILQFG